MSEFNINDALANLTTSLPEEIPGVEENTIVMRREISQQSTEAVQLEAKKDADELTGKMRDYIAPVTDDPRGQYLTVKQNGDAISLAALNSQIEHTKKATDMLMDSADIDRDPKTFSALAQLNKSLTDLIKTRNELVSSIEAQMAYSVPEEDEAVDNANPKAAGQTAEVKEGDSQENDNTVTFVGTKNLLQQIADSLGDVKV